MRRSSASWQSQGCQRAPAAGGRSPHTRRVEISKADVRGPDRAPDQRPTRCRRCATVFPRAAPVHGSCGHHQSRVRQHPRRACDDRFDAAGQVSAPRRRWQCSMASASLFGSSRGRRLNRLIAEIPPVAGASPRIRPRSGLRAVHCACTRMLQTCGRKYCTVTARLFVAIAGRHVQIPGVARSRVEQSLIDRTRRASASGLSGDV